MRAMRVMGLEQAVRRRQTERLRVGPFATLAMRAKMAIVSRMQGRRSQSRLALCEKHCQRSMGTVWR